MGSLIEIIGSVRPGYPNVDAGLLKTGGPESDEHAATGE